MPQGWTHYHSNNPFKPTMYVKQAYSELKAFTTGVAGIFGTEQVYSVNDLFDPDFSGVGHSPYGRDTLATLYRKYKVLAIKIDIMFTNPSADGLCVGMQLSPPNATAALAGQSINEAGEKQNVQLKYVNNTGRQTVQLGGYFPMHQLAQVSKLQFKANIENFAALAGASPAALFVPHLRIAAADVTGTGGLTIQAVTRLTFYAKWYDRIQLSQS